MTAALRVMPVRIALSLLAALACLVVRPSEASDPRGRITIVWTAPSGDEGQAADAYELRTSTVAPGSDLNAWWNAATPVAGVPEPAAPGNWQWMDVNNVTLGSTVHTALRARFGTIWSKPSPVLSWTAPAGPLLQSVSPTRIDAAGSRQFTVKGIGLAGVRQATFISATGTRMSAGLRVYTDTTAVVTADISPLGIGRATLELSGPAGTDALGGWVYVSVPATPDVVAPNAITDLAVTVVDHQSLVLSWTAPADTSPLGTVRATSYDVRRKAGGLDAWSWASATKINPSIPGLPGTHEALLVSGLTPGATYTFALAAGDAAGNWALPSNAVSATVLTADTVPPATVNDLAATLGEAGAANLRWTAPADDRGIVASYRIWRWNGATTTYPMAEAVLLENPPAPAAAGSAETWAAGAVAAGTRAAFKLAAVDPAGNVGTLSNPAVIDRTTDDLLAPAAPAEFSASIFNRGSVQLRWIAPGDDGITGRAHHYELRHMESPPVTGSWWLGIAGTVLGNNPKPAGKQEFTNLSNVTAGKIHGYALRAVDEAANASPWVTVTISVASAKAQSAAVPPPAPDSLYAAREPMGVRLTWRPAVSNDVVAFNVYCSHPGERPMLLATVDASVTSYLDPSLPSDLVRYSVSALAAEGTESRLAAWAEVPRQAESASLRVAPEGAAWRLSIAQPTAPDATPLAMEPDVAVFDVLGRLVARVAAHPSGGGWEARWDGSTRGGEAASGIFFVRATAGTWSRSQRILVRR